MRKKLTFLFWYLAFWVAFFTVARLLFIAYHHAEAAGLGWATLGGVLVRGLRMDLSAAAYLAVLPALLVALAVVLPAVIVRGIVRIFTVGMVLFVSLLATVDLELFAKWGYRIDATVLPYLRTPAEALASTGGSPIARLALILVALTALGVLGYGRLIAPRLAAAIGGSIAAAPALVLCAALLVIPIRGGLQWTPLNPSSVYFSTSEFANQAGLNVGWNFLHSITTHDYRRTNPYADAIDATLARRIVDSLVRTDDATTRRMLRVARPNVVIIIWESLTAKVVRRLGGAAGVTPHLDSLTHEGVLFDQLYAAGDRSAKGLVAILSGYPSLPHVQILNSPSKAAKLPALPGDFERAGYATSFYYGGELEFADFKSYLLSHHFARVVGKGAFAPKDWSSKWGAHDHVVLGRVLSDLRTAPRPFFTTVFTLSSHEPYDVPMAPVFPGTDETTRFLNAHAYADRSVGAFIAAAKHEPWWDSTLVVIIADHGHPLPRVAPSADERVWLDQHIPMLWLGGALAVRDTVVSTVGAQTDLAPTLLAQLGIAHARYAWGKNLLARDVTPFAYFAYMDGFGWVTPRGRLVWDHAAGRVMQRAGAADSADLRSGQAYQRLSYQDYLDR